jgi:S1-C subfamily serine protease
LDGLLKELFPEGMKKVVLADFKTAPAMGVRVNATSGETEKVGLLEGALIVAVNGVEVGTFEQYSIIRSSGASPAFNLIVYQNGKYQEMEVSPPGRRFGVDMTTFPKK